MVLEAYRFHRSPPPLSRASRPRRRRRQPTSGAAEAEGDGYQGETDQEGDAVRDDEPHVAGGYAVGDPEQEPGQQDGEVAEGDHTRNARAAYGGSAEPGRSPSARPRQRRRRRVRR